MGMCKISVASARKTRRFFPMAFVVFYTPAMGSCKSAFCAERGIMESFWLSVCDCKIKIVIATAMLVSLL